jgi:hypothetical protein
MRRMRLSPGYNSTFLSCSLAQNADRFFFMWGGRRVLSWCRRNQTAWRSAGMRAGEWVSEWASERVRLTELGHISSFGTRGMLVRRWPELGSGSSVPAQYFLYSFLCHRLVRCDRQTSFSFYFHFLRLSCFRTYKLYLTHSSLLKIKIYISSFSVWYSIGHYFSGNNIYSFERSGPLNAVERDA